MRVNSVGGILLRPNKWVILIVATLFAILTNLVLSSLERFEVVDLQLLSDPSFSDWENHWQLKGKSEIRVSETQLDLVNDSGVSGTLNQYIEFDAPGYIRLVVEAGVKNISLGHQSWAGGAAGIVYFDEHGNRLRQQIPIRILVDSPIKKYEYTERIDKGVARLGISIRLLRSAGILSVRNIELTQLAETSGYKRVKAVFATVWVIVGLYGIFLGCVFLTPFRLFCAGGLIAITLSLILAPPHIVGIVTQYFSELLNGVLQLVVPVRVVSEFLVDLEGSRPGGFGHFLLFFILGLAVNCFLRKSTMFYGVCSLLVFAFITEVLQVFVEGRGGNLEDFFIDSLGILASILVGLVVWSLRCFVRKL